MLDAKTLDKILTVILIIAIITAAALTIYVIITPKKGEEFTEFYILGEGGNASNYPSNLSAGEEGTVIVGVVNHEYEPVTYLFRAEIENKTIGEREMQLAHNETVEFPFTFSGSEKGKKKLEFLLFKQNQSESINLTTPYRELHLWIDFRFGNTMKMNVNRMDMPTSSETNAYESSIPPVKGE
ncbi:hypothetical protein C5S32_01600 [ANME-1 cluster archaeon GoMg1]|nr:hypothetical protein [ANME-1 cluster archaeon GoMg1]